MIDFKIPVPAEPESVESVRSKRPPLPEGSFPAASLGVWLALARQAGVDSVPAEQVGTVNINDLMRFDIPDHAGAQAAMAALDRINQALAPNEMLRWDCCAGMGVKFEMGRGSQPQGQDLHLYPDDPRAFDMLYDFPGDTIAVWKRPWIQARTLDGFPVEFRVFVMQGEVKAVANYYLQRGLPAHDWILQAAETAMVASKRIVRAMHEGGQTPAMPGMTQQFLETIGRHATLDFLVAEDGRVLFLEGGPGFGFGAHPCAFYDDNTGQVDSIEGLKLAVGEPAMALPQSGASRPPPKP